MNITNNVSNSMYQLTNNTDPKPAITRRHFFQLIAGLGLSTASLAGYVRLVEPNWLNTTHQEIPIAKLASSLDGLRIAQLSDIHLSQYFSPERLAEAISTVNQLAPDYLLLTGDYVGTDAEAAVGLIEPLRSLSMPIYAIYGNHDYWAGNATVTRHLQNANATILRNEAAQIGANLWLAGIDDLWSGRPDLAATLRPIPTDAATILLAHEPDFFDTVLQEEAPIALQLSGHSHGGQVRIPTIQADEAGHYSRALILPEYGRRYPIGLRHHNERFVYTNRGLGVWPLPYRFNCRPELTIFTLRSS